MDQAREPYAIQRRLEHRPAIRVHELPVAVLIRPPIGVVGPVIAVRPIGVATMAARIHRAARDLLHRRAGGLLAYRRMIGEGERERRGRSWREHKAPATSARATKNRSMEILLSPIHPLKPSLIL